MATDRLPNLAQMTEVERNRFFETRGIEIAQGGTAGEIRWLLGEMEKYGHIKRKTN